MPVMSEQPTLPPPSHPALLNVVVFQVTEVVGRPDDHWRLLQTLDACIPVCVCSAGGAGLSVRPEASSDVPDTISQQRALRSCR